MQNIGIILAGGKSSRMGKDKAMIRHKGATLLDHARNTLKATAVDTIFVLGRPDEPDGIADEAPFAGPAINLVQWINKQNLPLRVTVLPVDMPLLTPEILQYLMDVPEGAFYEDMYVPFSAPVTAHMPVPPERMKTLVRDLGLKSIKPEGNWVDKLKNINFPDDLELLDPQN